jgi:uncharacterized protein YcgI (DUF1989 family)
MTCEWCWSQAQRRAMLCGGSVVDRYNEVMAEQDLMGPLAGCPMVRDDNEPTEP